MEHGKLGKSPCASVLFVTEPPSSTDYTFGKGRDDTNNVYSVLFGMDKLPTGFISTGENRCLAKEVSCRWCPPAFESH
jgi:hypothetical protein